MDVLVRGGAAVDHPNGYGMTALSLAAYKGKTESVRHLLELGADPARTNRFGFSAIDQARTKGHTEIVTLLEKADRKP
jgi:ankyrin repeat protein